MGASFRSWLGSLLSLALFFAARWVCVGLVAPFFAATAFACVYLWAFVLRVPGFRQHLQEVEEASYAPSPPPRNNAESVECSSTPPPSAGAKDENEDDEEGVEDEADEADDDAEPFEEEAPAGSASTQPAPAVSSAPAPAAAPAPAPAPELAAAPAPAPAPAPVPTEDEAATGPSGGEPAVPVAARGSSSTSAVPAALAEAADASDEAPDAASSASEDLAERWRKEDEATADPAKAQELRQQGNEHFRAGKAHDAREAYSEALHLTPQSDKKERAILHSNRAACFQKLERWDDVVNDCRQAIELDPEYVKVYCRRSIANEALCKWHEAVEDLKKAIELEPSLKSKEYKRQAVLEKRAHEQFEKDKDEMLSKMKNLGNTVLGKFGMSVDNFKMEQDPDTGSYSIKYQN